MGALKQDEAGEGGGTDQVAGWPMGLSATDGRQTSFEWASRITAY